MYEVDSVEAAEMSTLVGRGMMCRLKVYVRAPYIHVLGTRLHDILHSLDPRLCPRTPAPCNTAVL